MKPQKFNTLTVAILAGVLGLSWALARNCRADSAVPKPPGLYDGYTVTLLPSGKWLATGGTKGKGGNDDEERARLYDPTTGTWTDTTSMTSKRVWHAATLLADGKVLAVGGQDEKGDVGTAEIYDPAAGTWAKTGSLATPRRGHRATLLADGTVLVTGGVAYRTNYPHTAWFASAERYDPRTAKWSATGPMTVERCDHTATLLTNGLVLVAGGKDQNANFLFSAELYSPTTGKFTKTGEMDTDARFFYTATLLTNGQVQLTATGGNYAWEVTNAWAAGKELYDPSTGKWRAIGPPRPHFVSSRDLDRTLTIRPESGSSFPASEEIEFLIESADRFGVTNIQLFRDGLKIGEGEESPMRYTLTNAGAGTYTFVAQAAYANGLASTSAPVTITFKSDALHVLLAPGPTEFVSERHVRTSPAVLLASVVGVNPDELATLTLNGKPQPLRTGNFVLNSPVTEGKNVFVLAATDKRGRTAQATTELYLNTRLPTLSITEPANLASINAAWIDVRGKFSATDLRRLTVNEMPAAISGNTFEVRSVLLQPGINTLSAVVQDMAGNLGTNAIIIDGPANTNIAWAIPVQVEVSPSGGFEPLVVTMNVKARVPGKILKVFYDFDGDTISDQTDTDLRPVQHTFKTSGQYFPVVTVQTTDGRFSNSRAGFWLFCGTRVNVQKPPVLMSVITVPNPVDLKWTATSNLYVLSGSEATITEFDSAGKSVRSLKGLGGKPTGFDVDETGNVYVALGGSNQVWKFKPTANAFEVDASFGNGGFIGNKDGRSGSGSNELNAPFDVAVVPDRNGRIILVSDSGNHRIDRFDEKGRFADSGFHVDSNGAFISSLGERGTNRGQFLNPLGLAFDDLHQNLFVADSMNNRVVVAHPRYGVLDASGEEGTSLGQFRSPSRVAVNDRGLCVTDPGNNRIQFFDRPEGGEFRALVPFNARFSLSSELGLKQPSSAVWIPDLLEEKIYVADAQNNRVLLIKFPADTPEVVWNQMREHLRKGNIEGAVSCFSEHSKDGYRQAYLAMEKKELLQIASELPAIKPITIENQTAQYHFEQDIQGQEITFPVRFIRDNGKWKIDEY